MYHKQGTDLVNVDKELVRKQGTKVIQRDFSKIVDGKIRHDSDAISLAIMQIVLSDIRYSLKDKKVMTLALEAVLRKHKKIQNIKDRKLKKAEKNTRKKNDKLVKKLRKEGKTEKEIQDIIFKEISTKEELINNIADEMREEIDASELIIGMKCGGSDGLSGITANPIVGEFSDILISKGGSTILTEVPEMFGAETLLMERCKDNETFEKTVALINDFKMYFKNHNQTIYENPSPGNKAGGISTLEDKSLGCTQKSGSAKVVDVLGYGETLKTKGLNLLSSPGNDLVAATALAMSGAHIVLFTTGRGTPFASPVPTLKIATNSRLAKAKGNWIDFNAGRMIEDKSKDELANDLFKLVLEVASGKKVKSEIAGFHDFAIFKQGVTL